MATVQAASFLHFVIVASLLASTHGAKPSRYSMPFNRTSFPKDFTFGAGTAAYQSEGAAYIDGKGPSIWDTFTKQHPVKIEFDEGKISGGVNPLGVRFYNNLINELLANGDHHPISTYLAASQKGKIGITIVTNWFIPKSPKSKEDIKAAYRELDFLFGWFVNPLTYGDYPEVMKAIVGHRLPKFTKEQSALVKGSIDFLGVNYYTTNYAANNPSPNKVNFSYSGDCQTILSTSKGGYPIGTPTALNWLFVYPKGMYDLMLYIKDKYKNPPIYITENGLADANNASLPVKEALKDGLRIRYLANHLQYLSKAIKEGVNVKGYYQWAFWDDFEWDAGYTVRFGLYYIDYKNNLKRYMKYSAYWFKKFLLH
ncbi:GLYCOSYL HYDROLASE [Salix koriyanagi]|uniref:GLYCOSYL HYDROLASE n=1 Tax=Salix koriyanagi TaxID=2511006 RepID=A0A9Q0X5S0_9ROSI|nr:GLYCOSYL HYDROLASE [Salix koriyanagi]